MSSPAIRNAAHDAEAALRRAGDLRHARAIRKLLVSHAALQAHARSQYAELVVLRRQRRRPR